MSNAPAPAKTSGNFQLQNKASIQAAESAHSSDVAAQARVNRARPVVHSQPPGAVPTAPHIPFGTKIPLPAVKPFVPAAAPTGAKPTPPPSGITPAAPKVKTASVGPGSTRSAAPTQAPYVPPTGRPVPAATLGGGQAKRPLTSMEKALAAINAKH